MGDETIPLPSTPLFSSPGGIADAPVTLTLTPQGSAVTILFTTDGSDRRLTRRTAQRYGKPFTIATTTVVRAVALDARGRTSETVTAGWIFPEQVAGQKKPPGAPDAFMDHGFGGGLPRSFVMDWSVASDADLAKPLRAAPTVVIAADPTDLFDESSGLYSRAASRGSRAASALYIQAGKGPQASDTVISISGESSRYHNITLKHSLRLRFESPSGVAGAMTSAEASRGRSIVLRHPTHDSWTVAGHWTTNRAAAKYFADAFAGGWMRAAGHASLSRQWVHVYLNASYWGVYEAIEQGDAGTAFTSLLEAGDNAQAEAIYGDVKPWRSLRERLSLLVNAAMNGSVVPQEWASAAASVDTAALIDYVLLNAWMTNMDWPERNYLIAQKDGKWTFLSWDAEWSMRPVDGDQVNMTGRIQGAPDGPAYVFSALCWWPEFRERVKERLAQLSSEGGLLHPASLTDGLNASAEAFRTLAPAEAARWASDSAAALAAWEKTLDWLLVKYALQRTTTLRQHFDAALDQYARRAEAAVRNAGNINESAGLAVLSPYKPLKIQRGNFGDRDGDGIPDEWEQLNGLDARDPRDALADSDKDGLSNLEEYLLGRDPSKGELTDGVFALEPSGVHSRANVPKIRHGQRVDLLSRPLSPAEAQAAREQEEMENEKR